jgi:hypothetical protein
MWASRQDVRFAVYSHDGKHLRTVINTCNVYRRRDGSEFVLDRGQRRPVYWEFGYPTTEIVR